MMFKKSVIALPFHTIEAQGMFHQKVMDAVEELLSTTDLWFAPGESTALGESSIMTLWSADEGSCGIRVVEHFGSNIATAQVLDRDEARAEQIHTVLAACMDAPSHEELLTSAQQSSDMQAIMVAMLVAVSNVEPDRDVDNVLLQVLDSDDVQVRAAAATGLLGRGQGSFVPRLKERREIETDAEVKSLLDDAITVCMGEGEIVFDKESREVGIKASKQKS